MKEPDFKKWIIKNCSNRDSSKQSVIYNRVFLHMNDFEIVFINQFAEEHAKPYQETIEDAILEVKGFDNWYLLRMGYTQKEIDKIINDGVKKIDKMLDELKTQKK